MCASRVPTSAGKCTSSNARASRCTFSSCSPPSDYVRAGRRQVRPWPEWTWVVWRRRAPLGISMDRMGSGTTWIPDAVTLPSRHIMAGSWELMLHGFVLLSTTSRAVRAATISSARSTGGCSWRVALSPVDNSRRVPCSASTLRRSAAAAIRCSCRRAKTYAGSRCTTGSIRTISGWSSARCTSGRVTRSLACSCTLRLRANRRSGPVAFMHRPSAMDNPVAPLGHHWQDATHISFGVLTAGLFGRQWKLEGSLFNGREPNEKRWDFDRIGSTRTPGARLSTTACRRLPRETTPAL